MDEQRNGHHGRQLTQRVLDSGLARELLWNCETNEEEEAWKEEDE